MKRIAFLFFVFLGCTKTDVTTPIAVATQSGQQMKIVVNTTFTNHDSIGYLFDCQDTARELVQGYIKINIRTFTYNVVHTSGNTNIMQVSLTEFYAQYPYDTISCQVYLNSALVFSKKSTNQIIADIPY